jgi:hypothetical protein
MARYSKAKWEELKAMSPAERSELTRLLLLRSLQNTRDDKAAASIGKVLIESEDDNKADSLFGEDDEIADVDEVRNSQNTPKP